MVRGGGGGGRHNQLVNTTKFGSHNILRPRIRACIFPQEKPGTAILKTELLSLMVCVPANYHILMPVDTEPQTSSYASIRAPRDSTVSAEGRQHEAARLMRMDNL